MTPVTNKEDKASAVGGKDSSPGKNNAFPGDDNGVSNILGSPFPSGEEEENHPTAGNRCRPRQEDEEQAQGRAKVQKTDDDDDDKKPAADGDDDDSFTTRLTAFLANRENYCQDGETIPDMLKRVVPKRDKEVGISPITQKWLDGFNKAPTKISSAEFWQNPDNTARPGETIPDFLKRIMPKHKKEVAISPNIPKKWLDLFKSIEENAMETNGAHSHSDSHEGADSSFTTPRLGRRRMPSPSSSRIPELDSPLPAPSKENDDGEEENDDGEEE